MNSNYMSILLQKDGLSFLVTKNNKVSHEDYLTFLPGMTLNENLRTIFSDNLYLQQEYKEVFFAYVGEKFILVPEEYLEQDNDLIQWLGYNSEVTEDDHIIKEYITSENSFLISSFPEEVYTFIQKKFSHQAISHSGSLLLNHLSIEEKSDHTFINLHHGQFELVVFREKRLLLYNIFDYASKDDVLYHLLNTFSQLGVDTNTVNLYYSGIMNDILLKMMLNFIRHVIPSNLDLDKLNHFTLIENLQPKL